MLGHGADTLEESCHLVEDQSIMQLPSLASMRKIMLGLLETPGDKDGERQVTLDLQWAKTLAQ